MKKAIVILILLFIPSIIYAKTYNYNEGVKEGNNYIKSTKYDTRGKYLIMSNQKFILNDDGTLSASSSFYNGGFLNRLEYCLSTGNTSCNGSTYLLIPASYWTLSGNSTSRYYVNNVSGLNIQSDTYSSGVRVTEFVKPQISVTGSGTYNNPWVFDNTYLVNLRTNNKKLGYFGSESEKKSSESKYATNECLSGSGLCANFDITVARGYGNNPNDGCNLKFIKNGEKRGTSTVKTYEISNIKSDISCVAIFDFDKFTIKFNANGGTGNMANKTATYGKNISLPNEFTRANYDFIGWNTAPDGSGDSYSVNSFKFDSIAGEKGIDQNNNLTLYAQWKLTTFKVTFNPNGGEIKNDITSKDILYGSEYGYMPTPTRSSYVFDGWFTKSNGGEQITSGRAMLRAENHTLYAIWHPRDYKMEFTYTGNYQVFETPFEGYYKVELWGASGGAERGWGTYGKGGYVRGYIYLKYGEKIYVYVGGAGTNTSYGNTAGGWNGGGNGGYMSYDSSGGGTGGGATDIRYFGNTTPSNSDLPWNSYLGLNSRIMVAGGAGGSSYECCVRSEGRRGGDGGSINNPSSSFGVGGSTGAGWHVANGAGGGGYYGGNAGGGWNNAGSGGSSYISGYGACRSIKSATDRTLTDNPVHYSGKRFLDGYTEMGKQAGNGRALFTYEGLIHGTGEPKWTTPGYYEFKVPKTGKYKIELWGASGGASRSNGQYGKGGYVSGEIKLTENEMLYVYVGGAGTSAYDVVSAFGGYNGGGNVNIGTVGVDGKGAGGGSGGGATDVRLISGIWNNEASLKSRIMVAGGAGGASYECCLRSAGYEGGAGGSSLNSGVLGAGGTSGVSWNGSYPAMQGAGGGGYYGGKAGSSWNEAGGGGSSYVSGANGFAAHSSGKTFTNTTVTAGVNAGNGKAIITFLGS